MSVVTKSAIARPGESKHANLQSITKEKLKKYLPKGSSHEVTDRVMELIASAEDDTGLEQAYLEEQFLTHTSIMKAMKVSIEEYVNAVKYVTLVGNLSNRKSWEIVFPDRLAKAEAKLAENKIKEENGEHFVQVNIDAHVSNYNSRPLVVELRSRIAVAFDLLNMPLRQRALMKNAQLMDGIAAPTPDGEQMVVTPTVQQAASATILAELRPVVDNKMELKIGMSDEALSVQNNIAAQLEKMAEAQSAQLARGRSIGEVQKLNLDCTDAVLEE